ncbi:hypothetical protein AAC387_Pa11g0938 [Persea americana]
MPTTKGTLVEALHGRGSTVPERNNLGHSTMVRILAIKDSSAEMSHEKGPSCMDEWKRSKATESPLAIARRALAHTHDAFTTTLTAVYAMTIKQIYKSSKRANPRREESTEPDSPIRDRKRVRRVKTGRSPTRLMADRFALHWQDKRSSNGPLSRKGSERMPIGRRDNNTEGDRFAQRVK